MHLLLAQTSGVGIILRLQRPTDHVRQPAPAVLFRIPFEAVLPRLREAEAPLLPAWLLERAGQLKSPRRLLRCSTSASRSDSRARSWFDGPVKLAAPLQAGVKLVSATGA